MKEQLRKGLPHLAFEMKHAMQDVMSDRAEAAVDMGGLPARRTISTLQLSAAISTVVVCFGRVRIARAAGFPSFDRVRNDRTREDITRCFAFDSHASENTSLVRARSRSPR